MSDLDQLRGLINELAVVHGRVTLSSGMEADYYIDLRRITLNGTAAPLVGRVLRAITADWDYDAVGGLTLGADPVAAAVMHASSGAVDAFVVRKAEKKHGMQQRIEGPAISGRRVLVVEDVTTTGASPLTAVEAARAAGAEVVGVALIVDRGGRAAIEAAGLPCRAAFTSPTSDWVDPAPILRRRPQQVSSSTHYSGLEPDATPDLVVGVGPHAEPWPDDPRLDPELLAGGDRRNVVDRYRYWHLDAIVRDLDQHRHEFAVAIENWQHDANIGTVVRTANAFNASEVVIVGRRRWNRRGAMVTDRYMRVVHVPDVAALGAHAETTGRALVAIDTGPGAQPIETATLPARALFVFGQEGPGLTDDARAAATSLYSIAQYGSTRSINAGVAAGIAMHAWIRQHAG